MTNSGRSSWYFGKAAKGSSSPEYSKVGILCTFFTLEENGHNKRLEQNNIEIINVLITVYVKTKVRNRNV